MIDWGVVIAGLIDRIDLNVIIVALIPVAVLVITQRGNRKAIEAAAKVSVENKIALAALTPVVEKLELNTNSMTKEIARLNKAEGETIGAERGRASAVAEAAIHAAGVKEGERNTSRLPIPTSAPPTEGATIPIEDIEGVTVRDPK